MPSGLTGLVPITLYFFLVFFSALTMMSPH
jgi:hypothetical protein